MTSDSKFEYQPQARRTVLALVGVLAFLAVFDLILSTHIIERVWTEWELYEQDAAIRH